MTQPATGPATFAAVKPRSKAPDADDSLLAGIVVAVNAVVRGLPVAQLVDPDVEEAWPDSVVEGALMLAVRLYRRKSSPAGVEAFGSEGAFYVRRNDPDIAMLLQLGDWAKPAVG